MPGFVRQHLRPLAGAVGLHLLLFALIVATAWRWSSTRPPVPMAIEGVAIDERSLPKDLAGPRPAPAAPVTPAPKPEPVEPVLATPAAPPDDAAERQRAAEAQAERERTAEAAREQAALETRRAEEAEAERARQQKLAAEEAARKAAEAEAERRKTAEAERRKAAEDAKRRKDADAAEQQAQETELQRRLAAEEEAAAAVAASGVVDQYRAELEQAIERSWIRPPSAQPGLECTLYVTQGERGTVLDVKLGSCNGDAAVRESITNAVFRASPLPAPADPRAFARRLEIVFRPTE